MTDMLQLEDVTCTDDLLPFTATRSGLDIRMGILTFREKWAYLLGPEAFTLTPVSAAPALAANLLPSRALAARVREELKRGALDQAAIDRLFVHGRLIRYPWHIFLHNAEALADDFVLLTAGRTSQPIPSSVQAISPENIFIEEGARLQHCLLNASTGPVYIGRDAEIMEGAMIRGPFAACKGAIVKMGAKIYGATTLGPFCTAGGEIKNTVFFGYSNKGHDGYLGDAVIGEWCNLGAGCSASNLKNNAGEVKVYHPASKGYLNAGMKCGLLMGDYSRAAINTAFHTGAVTGIGCNIFGEGPPPKYIPDFSWGQDGHTRYEWDKALRDIGNWKKLKNQVLTEKEILTLKHIFDQSNIQSFHS
jgi:UDP-N-acetylglucosamine diphosphorylase / glucose-1-phosphate thymidylyltransferase / UDP-N-acetylgalactosamine diphosphorylase / glucosamine-1-phosphate N-acetyltransferase / galactosamine-1-phosphate N-acetyltransferase